MQTKHSEQKQELTIPYQKFTDRVTPMNKPLEDWQKDICFSYVLENHPKAVGASLSTENKWDN